MADPSTIKRIQREAEERKRLKEEKKRLKEEEAAKAAAEAALAEKRARVQAKFIPTAKSPIRLSHPTTTTRESRPALEELKNDSVQERRRFTDIISRCPMYPKGGRSIHALTQVFALMDYKDGELIAEQGDIHDAYWIVKRGAVSAVRLGPNNTVTYNQQKGPGFEIGKSIFNAVHKAGEPEGVQEPSRERYVASGDMTAYYLHINTYRKHVKKLRKRVVVAGRKNEEGKMPESSRAQESEILPPPRMTTEEEVEILGPAVTKALTELGNSNKPSKDRLKKVSDNMEYKVLMAGEELYGPGKPAGEYWFMLGRRGGVRLEPPAGDSSATARTIGPCEGWGQLLLPDTSSRAPELSAGWRAVCTEDWTMLLSILCDHSQALLAGGFWQTQTAHASGMFLDRVPVTALLEESVRKKLLQGVKEVMFKPGQVALEQGKPVDGLYIVKLGSFQVFVADKLESKPAAKKAVFAHPMRPRASKEGKEGEDGMLVQAALRPTDFFGELALLAGKAGGAASATVRAGEDGGTALVVPLDLFHEYFTLPSHQPVWAAKKKLYEANLKRAQAKAEADAKVEEEAAKAPAPSAPSHSPAAPSHSPDKTAAPSHSAEKTAAPSPSPAATKYPAAPAYAEAEKAPQTAAAAPAKSILQSKMSSLTLDTIQVIGTLGRGAFGHVQLVRDKDKKIYALKTLNKAMLVETQQTKAVKSELSVLLELDHWTMIKCSGWWQDDDHLHFLMEPSLGGEVALLLEEKEYLEVPQAQFIAACLVVGLEYLHNKGIIYRDLKPENVLMDRDGYVKFTDFGFAKHLQGKNGETYTLCGTPEYLSPEVIRGAGHSFSTDYWSLGIVMYEMLIGETPYCGNNSMGTYNNICNATSVPWPEEYPMPAEAVSFVDGLLTKDTASRLGTAPGSLRSHPFFNGLDWSALAAKWLKSPVQVAVGGEEDLSRFNDYLGADARWKKYSPGPDDPFKDF